MPPGCSTTRPEAAARTHVTCGANLALESVGELREAPDATRRVSRFAGIADPPLRRVLLFRVLGLAASRKWSRARSGFRAQRELCSIHPFLQVCGRESEKRCRLSTR